MELHQKPINFKASEWKQFCGMSDLHLGSLYCDENHIKKDLIECRERDTRIIIVGDVFDLLLPKDNKRFQPSVLAEYLQNRDDIINEVVSRAFFIFKDYADLIDLISLGNHEETIIKYHSIDPIRLLIERLNQHLRENKSKHKIIHGGYIVYLQYIFSRESKGDGGQIVNVLCYHGKGGESPITKGMLDATRQKINFVYDVFLFGHKHNKFADASVNILPSSKGNINYRPRRDIQCGTYQKTYDVKKHSSSVSFGELKAFGAKDIGCVFFKIRWTGSGCLKLEVKAEI